MSNSKSGNMITSVITFLSVQSSDGGTYTYYAVQ